MTFNIRNNNEPPNRYDPDSLARIGSVEADVAEAQYVGVVVTEPVPKKKKKSTGQRIMIGVILALGAFAITLVTIFITRSSGDSDKAPTSGPVNGPNTIVADDSIGETCTFLKLRKLDSFLDCHETCKPSHCCKDNRCEIDVDCPSFGVCAERPVAANVSGSCRLDPSDPTGIQTCLDACEYGRCCFFPATEYPACADRHFCMQYQECSRLDDIRPQWFRSYDNEEGTNETMVAINRTCSPLENKQVEDLKKKDIMDCHNVCDDHLCCFTHDDDLNCKDEISDKCELYKPCEVLMETSKQKYQIENITIQEAVNQSSKHCTFPEINNDIEYSACYSICSPYLCCWSENNNCNKPGDDVCEQLGVCENIMNVTSGDIPKRNENVTINSQVDTICDEDSLRTRQGIQKCLGVCKAHMCCFTDDDQNCTDIHSFECTVYESCANLLIQQNDDNSPSHEKVKSLCETIDTQDGLTDCVGICADHLCCFQPDHLSSSCQNSTNCTNFRACEILVNGDKDPDKLAPVNNTLPHVLTNECDDLSTGAGISRCDSICKQARCCFEDGAGNCFSTNKDWCQSFEKCKDLSTSKIDNHYVDGPNSPKYKSDITDLCKKENLISNTDDTDTKVNLDLCHRICDPYDCCFTGNCTEGVQKDCPEYSGCEDLHTYKNPNNTTSLEFNSTHSYLGADVCLPSNYRDDPTKCNDLCESSGSKCCFENGQKSCYVQKLNFCIYNSLCEIVYKDQ